MIQDRTQRIGAEHIGGHGHDLSHRHMRCAQVRGERGGAGDIHIGNRQPGALSRQRPGQSAAHAAHALHRHMQAAHIIAAQFVPHRRHQAHSDAACRERARVAAHRAIGHRQAGDMGRTPGHHHHVMFGHANIFGGDIAPAQRRHGIAKRLQQRLGLRCAGQHDGLAAARLQAGHGVLVTHAARQAQRIGERRGVVGIGPTPHTAGGRAQMGGVDGDNRMQTGGGITHQRHLFVSIKAIGGFGRQGHKAQGFHGGGGHAHTPVLQI